MPPQLATSTSRLNLLGTIASKQGFPENYDEIAPIPPNPTPMSESLFIRNQIDIAASPAAVWDALVNPDKTKVYMFGCAALSDWQVGSPLLWEGTWEGQTMVFVQGNVAHIDAPHRLDYTVFDPNGTLADVPENYLTVSYVLEPTADGTRLHVSQGDYTQVGNGAQRYADSYNGGEGWNPILVQVKALVEGH